MDDTPRIVFDIYNIKSPYKGEQTVQVNTEWVKRVRHFGYPDRLRVVLDTKSEYLSAFSANSVEKGLAIHVGEMEAEEQPAVSRAPALRTWRPTSSDWRNRPGTPVSPSRPVGCSSTSSARSITPITRTWCARCRAPSNEAITTPTSNTRNWSTSEPPRYSGTYSS